MNQITKEKPSKLSEVLTWSLVGIGSLAFLATTCDGSLAIGNNLTTYPNLKESVKQTTTQPYNISERK